MCRRTLSVYLKFRFRVWVGCWEINQPIQPELNSKEMRLNNSTYTAKQEWHAGWTLVVAASMGFSFCSVMLASTGLFMGQLGEEFGWSRTLLSPGPSIATAMTAVLGPFLGMLIDRFGTRRVALPGLVLTMAAICSFSLLDGSQAQ